MLGRKAIHIDINPLSKFIVENLIRPLDFAELGDAFRRVVEEYQKHAPQTEEEIKKALKKYPYPSGIELMKNADVRTTSDPAGEGRDSRLPDAHVLWSRE